MPSSNKRISGCPKPKKIKLFQRIQNLKGERVRVVTTNKEITGIITGVTSNSFQINHFVFNFGEPFAIDVGFFEAECTFKKLQFQQPVIVHVVHLGQFNGCLVRLGIDFVEFEQELPEDIARWIIPLNRFVSVACIEDEEDEE